MVDELESLAAARRLRIAAVYGGVGFGPQVAAARRADILVATPGRLEDLIERGAVSLKRVRVLVLDEADRMLDMGFRPAVDRIVAKLERLVEHLREDGAGRSLVFVRTKRGADRLVKRLRGRDVEAVAMHGDKSQSQRERALARFERGDVLTLVATDIAARGIDVEDVNRVINYDAPGDRETYVHRIGRTGRAGRTGTGISFVLADEADEMGKIATGLGLRASLGGSAEPAPASTRPAGARRRRNRRRRSKVTV